MELDEAIKHCNDKVTELEQEAQQWLECNPIGEPRRRADKAYEDCKECAAEHKQLAEWLAELKEWRKLKPICSNDGILVFRIKDEVETYTKDDMTNEYLKGYNDCKDIIQSIGEWIEITNGRGGHECNLCGEYASNYQSGREYLSAFCPNCGAKMRQETDNESL